MNKRRLRIHVRHIKYEKKKNQNVGNEEYKMKIVTFTGVFKQTVQKKNKSTILASHIMILFIRCLYNTSD